MKLYSHTVSAVIGIALALVLMFGTENLTQWHRNSLPIEDWVDVRSVFVPDHVVNQDALVVYDRDIKKPFIADWTVKAMPVEESPTFICEAAGKKDYVAGDKNLPDAGITLEYIFRAHPCKWEPGDYILKTTWIIKRPGYEDVVLRRNSNVFKILPEGSQLYLSKEQVEKLEETQ